MRATHISSTDNVIDSRDVVRRIDELDSDRDTLADKAALGEWDADPDGRELRALKALAAQGEDCAEWSDGVTLIRDGYFERYARELAEDVGALKDSDKWPATCIDWAQAADELRSDYMALEFDGVTYWTQA